MNKRKTIPTANLYVTAPDKAMSGWGGAEGKVNLVVYAADTLEEARVVADNFRARPEFGKVNVTPRKPSAGARYVISVVDGKPWNTPGFQARLHAESAPAKKRAPRAGRPANVAHVRELVAFALRTQTMERRLDAYKESLRKKWRKGTYEMALAVKLLRSLMDEAAKAYDTRNGLSMFTTADRAAAALEAENKVRADIESEEGPMGADLIAKMNAKKPRKSR